MRNMCRAETQIISTCRCGVRMAAHLIEVNHNTHLIHGLVGSAFSVFASGITEQANYCIPYSPLVSLVSPKPRRLPIICEPAAEQEHPNIPCERC